MREAHNPPARSVNWGKPRIAAGAPLATGGIKRFSRSTFMYGGRVRLRGVSMKALTKIVAVLALVAACPPLVCRYQCRNDRLVP